MDLLAGLALDPAQSLVFCGYLAGGVALGTVSGLTPGVHANTFALLLAGLAASVPGPLAFLGAAMLAAGTVHTFLDVVPALALGVPDPAMASSALPGHRLVLEGRGREALRLSALGSGCAVALAAVLAVPVTRVMRVAYPVLRAHLPLVLGTAVLALVLTESGLRAKLGGALAAAASGALGVATLDLPTGGLVGAGNMLAPLFAGLFGAPVLLDALTGAGVPEQDSPEVTIPPVAVGAFALVGTLGGAAVGYLPGVSSAVAATLALGVVPAAGARGFLVTTSGVNTANTVFALFALVAFGTPRTGVLVAVQRAGVAVDLRPLLAGVVAGGAAGFVLVVRLGDRYLETVGRLDYTRLSVSVLGLLVVLIAVLTGPLGIAVFAAATLAGLVPVRFGARRANLMGVLLVPLALGL